MKTDPFSDSLQFILGNSPDAISLGWGRWPMTALYAALLLAGLAIAARLWSTTPAQRTAGHAFTALFRVLIGAMWFQGALWKLPLPEPGGLVYWTGQMADHAAFPFVADLVRTLALPHMAICAPLVFAAELGLAVSFTLGLFVRPVAVLGAVYALGLWIGLYRHPGEWPWEYIFLAVVQGQFAVIAAGRALGLDAFVLRRR